MFNTYFAEKMMQFQTQAIERHARQLWKFQLLRNEMKPATAQITEQVKPVCCLA